MPAMGDVEGGTSENLQNSSFQRRLESSPPVFSKAWTGLGPSLRWDDKIFRRSQGLNSSTGAASRPKMAETPRQCSTFAGESR
jgi:hypothetical protein